MHATALSHCYISETMRAVTAQAEIDYDAQFVQLVYRQLIAERGRMLNRTVLTRGVEGSRGLPGSGAHEFEPPASWSPKLLHSHNTAILGQFA